MRSARSGRCSVATRGGAEGAHQDGLDRANRYAFLCGPGFLGGTGWTGRKIPTGVENDVPNSPVTACNGPKMAF